MSDMTPEQAEQALRTKIRDAGLNRCRILSDWKGAPCDCGLCLIDRLCDRNTADLVALRARCIVCGYIKKPVGRDASMLGPTLCDDECPGYRQQPYPGSLWPFESEAEFGYPVSNDATTKGGAR